jgi:ABC-type multidrug transport system fused ATPase/permease subunit
VMLLEDGRIAEHGTHAELVNHSGRYRELFDLGHRAASVPELAKVVGG